MYREQHNIAFPGGLHADPLYAMARHLSPHGFMINGEPVEQDRIGEMMDSYSDPNMEVELSAHNGDPQAERDLVHIGRYMMQRGRNPWPTAQASLPPSALNTAANAVREKIGLPVESSQEATFSPLASAVRDEMSVESKWTVIALGEMQQPGGVGALQDSYNPQVDGPNPDGPNFIDNSQNSHEQEVALETWVNRVIDLLNQGKLEDEILAMLAHDGCPDPQAVMQRAMQQNVETPVSDQAGTDPFQLPMNQPPLSGGNESPTMTPQSVNASRVNSDGDRVRVKTTGKTGRVVASFLDVWGEGTIKVALDEGGIADHRPSQVVGIDDIVVPEDPLGEIQKFLDSVPEPGETRMGIEARIHNLTNASSMLHDARLSRRTPATDRIRADKLKMDVDAELSSLRVARTKLQESDLDYLDSRPGFQINAFSVADGTSPIDETFTQRLAEDATILVQELPEEMVSDAPGVELRAFHHAAANYASDTATDQFLTEVERQRIARLSSFDTLRTAATNPDPFEPFDGPAEQLFM